MADRYWVGGTANWDATAGTKWATTSGGAGGASVPGSLDDVFFDAASGAVTCTVSVSATCQSLNFTGFTGTFAGSGQISIFSGNLTIVSGVTWTHTGTFVFSAASLVTTSGKTLGAVILNNSASSVSLQDAFTSSGTITVTQGTFTTNDYNVTAGQISSSNSNTRTINLGSSTVTLSLNGQAILFTTPTNLTFNAGTSSIVLTGAGPDVEGGGQTFYDVSFTGTLATSGATNLRYIDGANTFNNLSVTGPASAGVVELEFRNNQTINGTFSTTGTAGNQRVWFRSNTYGVRRTLTINSAPSLTDADFRDIIVNGTSAPISGTRIGNRGACTGITFDAPKTVYWNLAGTQGWFADGWAATSGGTPNTNNFPLPQDTAIFNNAGAAGTVSVGTAAMGFPTVDMSARTSAMTFSFSGNATCYGSWTNGSGTTLSGTAALTFSGEGTKTITSAGKTFTCPITIDAYGGTVELADALNIGTQTLTVTNGTFDTKGYAVTAGSLSSSNFNVRTIKLGSSTVTLSSGGALTFTTNANITFDAGTSSISVTNNFPRLDCGSALGLTFYNVTTASNSSLFIRGINTFNNLTITPTASAGLATLGLNANQTINGTLTVAGASAIRRVFVRSTDSANNAIVGTTRTLTVNNLSANDCDFRDITIAGSAAGSSPTRAGDCGGNTGITFPSPKTVYWNLSGTNNWLSTAWATSSGGTPSVNNFPLAQDTAVFDDAGAVGTATVSAMNICAIDASARTSAMTLNWASATPCYGNFTLGSGVTIAGTATATFSGRGTQTFTSAGKTITFPITVDSFSGTFQLGDALTTSNTITHTSGTFDAVTYNVSCTTFASSSSTVRTLYMGSGTWSLSGTSSTWDTSTITNLTFYKGTANIIFTDTSASSRSFNGGGLSFNKFTIGGATGTSSLTFQGNNQFTELASTKTVAHTIALGTTTQTFGAWTVTGSAGNVVTLTGTSTTNVLAGSCTSGINYLAMGSIGFAATSPAEFYAGANSTGTATAPVYRTAKPADDIRYWVGGTGNWSSTTKWSASSGGASGASVPRSHDDVVFDSASNATAYTATVDAVTGGIRCKALTIAGPASGNVTLAGTFDLNIHGDVTLPATGLTITYSGNITLSGSTTGKTFTTNGVTLASAITVNGVGCEWSLGSAATTGNTFTVTNGTFNTANFSFTPVRLASSNTNTRSLLLGSSTVSLGVGGSGTLINFTNPINLTFTAGTSAITLAGTSPTVQGGGVTFYDASFNSTSSGTITINNANTFNNLSVTGITSAGLKEIALSANQTINGTLTLSAGTNATMRTFVRSNTIGTTRTLTCNAVTATDVDFRDITIDGSAAPVSGTRLGDCKGNSGITFDAGKTVYWNLAGNQNWSATAWATSSGGTPAVNNFPLAQDTAIFEAASPASGATTTINATYNIGTIDMSARTTNTMTLATGTTTPAIYGNWINGTGTTLSGTGALTFAGRGSQTITSAGKTFTQALNIASPGGSVTLQDSFVCTQTANDMTLTEGTFDANNYNVTLSGRMVLNSATNKTVNIGSGTWTIGTAGIGNTWLGAANLTVTGTGVISIASPSGGLFQGGNISYSGITLNQGSTGTLTITGDNTFANITNTASGATTIALGTTTQRVANFTATGTAGNILTITGSTSDLIYTGAGSITGLDYLDVQGLAYGPNGELTGIWSAGSNSTNSGSLGWDFTSGAAVLTATITEAYTSAEAQDTATNTFNASATENSTLADVVLAAGIYTVAISENSTLADNSDAPFTISVSIAEGTTLANFQQAISAIAASVVEGSTLADTEAAANLYNAAIQETATLADAASTASILSAIIIENQTNLSIQAAQANFNAARVEPVASADIAAAQANFNSAIAEASTLADILDAIRVLADTVTENSDLADTQDRTAIFFALDTEGLVIQDLQAAQANFNSNTQENLLILDQEVGYGWFRIVDTQAANWTLIGSSQWINNNEDIVFWINNAGFAVSWTTASGASVWTQINNQSGVVWTEINNSQGT